MLLNWLKNDIAKDLALVKGIGAGLKGRRTSVDKPAVAAVSVGLLGSALGFVGEMLSGDGEADKPKEVPYWDQGGTNDWHYRQWDHVD